MDGATCEQIRNQMASPVNRYRQSQMGGATSEKIETPGNSKYMPTVNIWCHY